MVVTLIHATPLDVADLAIGKCWDKPSKSLGHKIERIHRVGNKNKHASTLEHINYTFDIDGMSRACLQELARHRMQSLSVKSTRYTLKELKDATDFRPFFVPTGCCYMDDQVIYMLGQVKKMLKEGVSNDRVKYMLPEAYKTSLVSTMNLRALQHFLQLRTSKAALWEIRELAEAMYRATPDSHKFMLEEFMPEVEEEHEGQTHIVFEEE